MKLETYLCYDLKDLTKKAAHAPCSANRHNKLVLQELKEYLYLQNASQEQDLIEKQKQKNNMMQYMITQHNMATPTAI